MQCWIFAVANAARQAAENSGKRAAALVVTAISAMALLTGCVSNPPLISGDSLTDPASYVLNAGDKVRIIVSNQPQLTGEFDVTDDGAIAFPLIGMIPARNESLTQVSAAIRQKLADGYVLDPRVSIEVLNYRPFYIFGEVKRPGSYPYVKGMTVEQAVAAASGFTYRANSRTIFLKRGDQGERSVPMRAGAIQILPGDTIRIGERYL